MLRITVELLPQGDEARARHLGTAYISNDLSGDLVHGNYAVRLSKWGRPKETWKKGEVKGFDRLRLGPWDLLLRALVATVGRRNQVDGDEPGAQTVEEKLL